MATVVREMTGMAGVHAIYIFTVHIRYFSGYTSDAENYGNRAAPRGGRGPYRGNRGPRGGGMRGGCTLNHNLIFLCFMFELIVGRGRGGYDSGYRRPQNDDDHGNLAYVHSIDTDFIQTCQFLLHPCFKFYLIPGQDGFQNNDFNRPPPFGRRRQDDDTTVDNADRSKICTWHETSVVKW